MSNRVVSEADTVVLDGKDDQSWRPTWGEVLKLPNSRDYLAKKAKREKKDARP